MLPGTLVCSVRAQQLKTSVCKLEIIENISTHQVVIPVASMQLLRHWLQDMYDFFFWNTVVKLDFLANTGFFMVQLLMLESL